MDELVAERLRTALELYGVGEAMLRQRLRRDDPGATAEQMDQRVAAWLLERPGAENGDYPGVVSARRW